MLQLPHHIKRLNLKKNHAYLLTQIYFLSKAKGYCYASNYYFAEIFGITIATVNRHLKTLEDAGYISRFTCGNRRTIKHNLPEEVGSEKGTKRHSKQHCTFGNLQPSSTGPEKTNTDREKKWDVTSKSAATHTFRKFWDSINF